MLEARFPEEYGGFTRQVVGRALVYTGEVDIPDVGRRRLAIIFSGRPRTRPPIVMADGPRCSHHRYRWARPTSLCIWHPADPPPGKWTLEEGLVGLVDRARVHLVKEAWWRVNDRWDSPEVHREPRGNENRPSARVAKIVRRQRCWCDSTRYRSCHGSGSVEDELEVLGLI